MAQLQALLSVLLLALAEGASGIQKRPLVSSLVAAQWDFSVPEHILQRAFLPQVGSVRQTQQIPSPCSN